MNDPTPLLKRAGAALLPIVTEGLNQLPPEDRRLTRRILETKSARLQLTVDPDPFRISGWLVRPGEEPAHLFSLVGEPVNLSLN